MPYIINMNNAASLTLFPGVTYLQHQRPRFVRIPEGRWVYIGRMLVDPNTGAIAITKIEIYSVRNGMETFEGYAEGKLAIRLVSEMAEEAARLWAQR